MQVAITPLKKPYRGRSPEAAYIGRAEEMGTDDEVRREVEEAISSILSVEVLLARMRLVYIRRSNSLKISFLRVHAFEHSLDNQVHAWKSS